MDIICTRCGELWEVSHIYDVRESLACHPMGDSSRMWATDEGWDVRGSTILRCSTCRENERARKAGDGVHDVTSIDSDGKPAGAFKDYLEDVKTVCDLLGDDTDGAAAMLEDFEFAGLLDRSTRTTN